MLTEMNLQQYIHSTDISPYTKVNLPSTDYLKKINVGQDEPRLLYKQALIADDIWNHGKFQNALDKALGRKYDSKDMLTRSYNPATDGFWIDKLRHNRDSEGEKAYINEMRRNIETNLRERLQVGENVVHYHIIGNELYSEDFPNEPFSEVLKRGIAYRLEHGTEEAKREASELEGWMNIQEKFANPDTPIGTKMTVFSPPGMVDDTAYDRTLVDEYELVEDKDGRYMKLTRRIVDFDDADYAKAAYSLDKQYFADYDDRPLDAWYLSHPIEGTLADLKIKGMSSVSFDKIYQSPMLQGMIQAYVDAITAENINWRQVALTINAIYNQVDAEEKAILGNEAVTEQQLYLSKDIIDSNIQILGMQTPEERGGAGCPTSKGYDMSNFFSFDTINSASWYGGAYGAMSGNCPEIKCPCGWKASDSQAKDIQAGTLTACPDCGWVPGTTYKIKEEPESKPKEL